MCRLVWSLTPLISQPTLQPPLGEQGQASPADCLALQVYQAVEMPGSPFLSSQMGSGFCGAVSVVFLEWNPPLAKSSASRPWVGYQPLASSVPHPYPHLVPKGKCLLVGPGSQVGT